MNRLLMEYGATAGDLAKPVIEKKRLLLEFLNSFPSFLVVDDIDSVLDDCDVVSLFTHEIPHTKSTVLLTSRRDIPGVRSLIVKGFDGAESELFVKSRIHLYGLDPKAFPATVIAEISTVTEGSPLYMDDLMRLTRIIEVPRAIQSWADKRGDEARKYALQREMEKLSGDAKKVLIAAAVTDDPVSYAELESVLEFSEDRLTSALAELQTLFLLPKPRIVEGEQRFQINLNTKKLVRLVEGASDLYARIETASKALSGKLPDVGRGLVGALIRQAYLLINSDRFPEAEALLLNSVQKYPNAADLHGFLGYVYRRWGRIADARSHFESAYKLKSTNEDTYRQWVKMEVAEKEWTRAISAAEKALKLIPGFYEMVHLKTDAKLKSGFDFQYRLQREKAEKIWTDAADELKRAVKSPEALLHGERDISAAMYRTLVICLDLLGDLRELNRWFRQWKAEHPDDPNVMRQQEIISRKRGLAFSPGG